MAYDLAELQKLQGGGGGRFGMFWWQSAGIDIHVPYIYIYII